MKLLFLYKSICELAFVLAIAHCVTYPFGFGHRYGVLAVLVIYAAAARFSADREHFLKRFKFISLIWFPVLVMAFLMDKVGFAPFSDTVALAAVSFTAGIAFLRASVHFDDTLKNPVYQFLNLSAVLSVGLVGFVLSSQTVVSGFVFAIKTLYRYTLYNLFRGVLSLVGTVAGGDDPVLEIGQKENLRHEYVMGDAAPSTFNMARATGNDTRKIIVAVICAAVLIFVIYKLIRWLMDGGKVRGQVFLSGERSALKINSPKKKRNEKGNRAAIRRYYRRFLKLCASKGIKIRPASASADIAEQARGVIANGEALREIYIRARYGEGEITDEDVASASSLVSRGRLRRHP